MSVAAAPSVSSVNPATGEVIAVHACDDGAAVDAALDRAHAGQARWRAAGFAERAEVLRAIARELRARREEAAALITAEMGKTIAEARAEIDKSAWVCEYYADDGEAQLAPRRVETEWRATYVQHEPLGVVLAVMPWNYPVWQVMRAAAPALMAGNAIVLKHASNVVGCARLLGEIVASAAGEHAILEVVVVPATGVAGLIADRRVAAVTLTGSEHAGVSVALACAKHLKKSVLELGGSDPFVVLEDADLDAAVAAAVTGRFLNAGQSCIAAKRFVVVEAVADAFEESFAAAAGALTVGDPTTDVDLGPMARADLRDELHRQVRGALRDGGRLLVGGAAPAGPGAYYAPTVVAGVERGSLVAREETFGPVAAIMRAASEAEAIELANAVEFGLSSSLWTRDLDRARRLAGRIEAGAVFVNAFSASDPRMPFGGIKRSGWGRELGPWGILEFVNVQSVTIAPKGA